MFCHKGLLHSPMHCCTAPSSHFDTRTCTRAHTQARTHTHIHTHTHARTHIRKHTQTHTSKHTCTCAFCCAASRNCYNIQAGMPLGWCGSCVQIQAYTHKHKRTCSAAQHPVIATISGLDAIGTALTAATALSARCSSTKTCGACKSKRHACGPCRTCDALACNER